MIQRVPRGNLNSRVWLFVRLPESVVTAVFEGACRCTLAE